MEQNVTLRPCRVFELPQICRLYREAFPVSERKPFTMLLKQRRQGLSEMLTIRKDGRYAGLMIVVRHKDMALLDFFAISPQVRGGGTGSLALDMLSERYARQRLFLEIEREDPLADNALQRTRRKAFYLQNGMRESGVWMRAYGSDMELLHAGSPVSFEEYCALLAATLGPRCYRIVRPVRQ